MTDLIPIEQPGWSLEFGQEGSPLVVVLHDWYGRLPWLTVYGQELARRGFRCIIPDLYNGVATIDNETARELKQGVDLALALDVIDDAIQTGREHGSTRVGVIGFSMGGWLALLHAQRGEADAVVAYYGSLDVAEHGVIPCPVLLQLAELDNWSQESEPENLILDLKDHGTPVTEYTYLGAEHSFANESLPDKWDPSASALSLERTVTFLEGLLRD